MINSAGDSSAAATLCEAEIDNRVKLFADLEDPDIIMDLREVLHSDKKTKFNVFWDECTKFLQENIGLAVDERRHSHVTHIASALSVRDLQQQVAAQCPPSTPVPSISWLSLQFWPKSAHAHSKIHYTRRFRVKYMVQARQFRKNHEDSHYAACIFRYEREMAAKFRQHSLFVCMDDKHRVKVGEPHHPVAAAERGKKVLVGHNTSFEVADHDFTKFSLIPSVSLLVNIPKDVTESWYSGQVFIGLKEGAYEPSSPLRHVTELNGTLKKYGLLSGKSVLFVYTDGGPDHRLTYLSVKISLICLFLSCDFDYLCACRTAPCHSWRNPAERVMSIVNLGLQAVGLMRQELSDTEEALIASSNNLSQLRNLAQKNPEIVAAVRDSIEPVKVLLSSIFQRLELHGQKFSMFTPANENDLMQMWSVLQSVDPSLEYGKVYRQESLKDLSKLDAFISHCCCSRHYSFTIKKCGEESCTMCKPVRMPLDVFKSISYLPDPVPGEDGHYLPFSEVYGTNTTEQHRPSLQAKRGKQKTLPFAASIQHVKNVDILVQCEECQMWRLLYSKHKLTSTNKKALQQALDGVTYTCGAQIGDLELGEKFADVYARQIRCYEPVEKLYYSAGKYEPICIYCSSDENLVLKQDQYPQCANCAGKHPILKRK